MDKFLDENENKNENYIDLIKNNFDLLKLFLILAGIGAIAGLNYFILSKLRNFNIIIEIIIYTILFCAIISIDYVDYKIIKDKDNKILDINKDIEILNHINNAQLQAEISARVEESKRAEKNNSIAINYQTKNAELEKTITDLKNKISKINDELEIKERRIAALLRKKETIVKPKIKPELTKITEITEKHEQKLSETIL
jgi:hypothetical protein